MALLFFFSMTPQASRGQDYPDTGDDDIDQVVARVSFIQGPVSYARGDDPDEWDPAAVNIPFALGDRLYSSDQGRAELSLPGGNFVRIGRRSYVSALTLSYDTKQFYVGNGAATFTVRRLGPDEIFEIDTPSVAVTVDQPGRYRVEVDENGDTRVIVRSGVAFVAANGRQVTVERAEMRIYGADAAEYELVGLRQADTFDRWVDERQARFDARYRNAYQYADEEIVGLDDLADNGRWEQIPDYGYAWTPTVVAVGWQPFTIGHWFWQDPWGWSWISEEPWGWAPSHYGRWTFYRSRWYWVPVRRRVEVVRYAPAIVAFVSVGGNIGWFPLHPRDRFVPWWGRRERVVENVTFVNRTRVVLVDERTFVSSRRVTTSIIRDERIIREATTVRISDRRLPVPQRESIRVTAERRQVERPSAAIISRQVVVRNAPTPPPPRFDEKVRVIRERQGQPLTTREIVDMGAKDFKSNRRIQIRTAGETKGNFTARGGQGDQAGKAVQAQPLAPLKGRNLATPDNPVSTDFSRRVQREQQKDERQIQQQQQKDQKQQGRDQDQLLKKQERDREKDQKQLERDQKQLQDQQRKDQEFQRKDLERKQQEQDRLQKQQERDQDQLLKKQERDREKDQKQLQDQQRKDQDLQRKDLERKQQDQDQLLKKQERDREKDQKQLQDQQRKDQDLQRKDLERKQQEQDRLQKQQQQDQERKNQQLQQQQRKDLQQQDDLRRKQPQDDQQKQRQLQQDQQRQQQQLQQDQKKQEQDQRRQDLERQRLEKQQQDKQGRDLDRDRQEQLRQKKLDEQQRKGPPPDDRTPPRTKERKDQDAPPPPPPGPPPEPPPR